MKNEIKANGKNTSKSLTELLCQAEMRVYSEPFVRLKKGIFSY